MLDIVKWQDRGAMRACQSIGSGGRHCEMAGVEILGVNGAVQDRLDLIGHRGCDGVQGEEVDVVVVGVAKDSSIGDEWTVSLRKVWRRNGVLR
jgi:hypothetical protein